VNRWHFFGRAAAGHAFAAQAAQVPRTDSAARAVEALCGQADPQPICRGTRCAGYAAWENAVREPPTYRSAIGDADRHALCRLYRRGDIAQSLCGKNHRVLGENSGEWYERSPLAHLDRRRAQVMRIVTSTDSRVPAGQREVLHQALLQAKLGRESRCPRDEAQGYDDAAPRVTAYPRILALRERTRSATAPAP
jgi:hypothetical protein